MVFIILMVTLSDGVSILLMGLLRTLFILLMVTLPDVIFILRMVTLRDVVFIKCYDSLYKSTANNIRVWFSQLNMFHQSTLALTNCLDCFSSKVHHWYWQPYYINIVYLLLSTHHSLGCSTHTDNEVSYLSTHVIVMDSTRRGERNQILGNYCDEIE